MAIDIGAAPIDRTSTVGSGYTIIDKNNPANADGLLYNIQVYADPFGGGITGLRVGTFYTTNGNTLKCRDSVLIGNLTAGFHTITGLSIAVQEGDYIGCYFTGGWLEADASGFSGIWSMGGEYIDPNDEQEYNFYDGQAISLYGYNVPVTYYFNGHSASAWTNPGNFDDGNIATFASVSSDSDIHEFNSNTCPGTDLGVITKVELRVHGKGDGNDQIELTPVFVGGDGNVHETVPVVDPGGWTAYVDITLDPNHPSPWTWAAVQALGCDVNRDAVSKANTMYGSVVEIRVTYWAPPESDIDVGAIPIDRTGYKIQGTTHIDANNPANASGTLHTVLVYVNENITGLRVGTFYKTNGLTFKCRDSVLIGNAAVGLQTFNGLSITVEAGDYIGFYFDSGKIDSTTIGFAGRWYVSGEYIDPGDETDYGFADGAAISIYGYGDIVPLVAVPRHGFVNFQDPGIV